MRTNVEYSHWAGVWKVRRTNIFVWLWYLSFWEFWYIMPIKLYILENTHYIETSYLIPTCVYVNLSKYQFLRYYKKFPHFSRAEKEKNIFFSLKLSGYSSEMRYNFIYKLFSSSDRSLSLVLPNDSWHNLKHGSTQRAGWSAQWPHW